MVFDIQGGIITDISITTSSDYLGDYEPNTLTITFTPATTLPIQKGSLEIISPDWAYLRDVALNQSVISYPNTDVTSCSSPSFTTTRIDESEYNILHIDYTDLIGENTDTVTITCLGWKNPILREELPGFMLKTLDSGEY